MRYSNLFLSVLCCVVVYGPAIGVVATTSGSNLTAFNGTGATNNNQWNSLTNARAGMGTTAASANFGNCNAVVLRCATPKCSSGGCADAGVARSIVAGCVNSNDSCKKHGDDLIDYIAAQVVAQSSAKLREQENAVAIAQANAQAQAAAANQNNEQVRQMAEQMAQMQAQMQESMDAMAERMAAQSASQNAQLQDAIEQQRAAAAANVVVPASGGMTTSELDMISDVPGLEGLSTAEKIAAKNGISADILVREQMGGQITQTIENAMTEMAELKIALDEIIEYAGCDAGITYCTGPKRVKKFKDMVNAFFDPYEGVIENTYDALILAMTLGIDVSDVIMLLSDSCNIWGKYLCGTCDSTMQANTSNTNSSDYKIHGRCECNNGDKNCYWRVKTEGADGRVAKNQPHCRLVDTIQAKGDVWREWIDSNSGITGSTQVACASDVIDNIGIFRGRRKQTTMDIETLRRLVAQDSRSCRGQTVKDSSGGSHFELRPDKNSTDPVADACGFKACAVTAENTEYEKMLDDAINTRRLPERTLGKSSTDKSAFCYVSEDRAPEASVTGVSGVSHAGLCSLGTVEICVIVVFVHGWNNQNNVCQRRHLLLAVCLMSRQA